MSNNEKSEILRQFFIVEKRFQIQFFFLRLDFLSEAPSKLNVSDLDDFCSLANLYASNTPQSFRKVSFFLLNFFKIRFENDFQRNFIRVFSTKSIEHFLKKRFQFIKRYVYPFLFKNYSKQIN